jgi:DNA-binding response OmpR family regulator
VPGETILIVDDSAVTLKLSAIALRSAGYRVHLCSNAEQALMTMGTMTPDLMLVDIQLPGMDGLELARQTRQNPRTSNVLIIAFTAMDVEDMHHAFEAGCDGYISKPFDIELLRERVGALLGGSSESPPADAGTAVPAEPTSRPLTLAGPEMDALRRKFLTGALRDVRRMLEFLGQGFEAAAASRMLHEWIGSAGALGYPKIAEHARRGEQLLAESNWSRAKMRTILDELAVLLSAPPEAAEAHIPDFIVKQLVRRRIALVAFTGEELDNACAVLESSGALPYLFDAQEPVDSDAISYCAAVVVSVCPETLASPWLGPDSTGMPRQPRVHVGGRNELLALGPEAQARAVEFLMDGWQKEEFVMRLSMAISRAQAAAAELSQASSGPPCAEISRPEVMVADDDPNVAAVVTRALECSDVEVRTVSNGADALRLIREHPPHVAVLDVNMPGINGFELLAAIRQDKLPVRIVMLTARQQEKDIVRGFELGADDYVVKPFNPLELVARVKRLL